MPTVRDRLRANAPSGLAALGISGCVLCCALPLLLAAGVVTGSAAAMLADWLPGVAAALVAAAALTWWWTSRGDRCASCGDSSNNPGGALVADCACSTQPQETRR